MLDKPTHETMTFGQALEALKAGKKVARRGWNGKGMFLWLKPATVVNSEWCHDPNLKQIADENGGLIQALGTICMFTHDSTGRKAVLSGWLASQSDMLLDDWEIVGEEEPPADTPTPQGDKPPVDPDDHTGAERLGGLIGTLMAPLALAKLAPGQSGTPPTINVNVWSIH